MFVQCILIGITDKAKDDDGINEDSNAADGQYTGVHHFIRDDIGKWMIFVIAQDVNMAQPDMDPLEANKFIGSASY